MNISYAVVSAFERTKDNSGARSSRRFFTIALLVVFFLALMGSLAAGVSVYQSTANAQSHTNNVRMQSGLMTSIIHANDSADSIAQGEGPEGHSLVLTEHLDSGDFEMRFYLHEGNVVQEYSTQGAAYTPGRAQALIPSETFEFSVSGNLVTIATDDGSFDVALRSTQGRSS